MYIDTRNKRILNLHRVKRLENTEVFFEVPGHQDYAFSTLGRLHKKNDKSWHRVKMENNGICDYYVIDGKNITVLSLIKKVFFTGLNVYLQESNGKYPYALENINVNNLNEKNELLTFIDGDIKKWLYLKYRGIWIRACSPAFKKLNPQYKNTTISEHWLLYPEDCKQYLLDHSYYYPEPLEVDKDLVSHGTIDEYREGNVILLPKYINHMFIKKKSQFGYGIKQTITQNGDVHYSIPSSYKKNNRYDRSRLTFDNYQECLHAARKKRFDYINEIIEREWEYDYLPYYILDLLEDIAHKTLEGKVKLLEPSDEMLKILGVN